MYKNSKNIVLYIIYIRAQLGSVDEKNQTIKSHPTVPLRMYTVYFTAIISLPS
jgi:hypothetical protein